MSRIDKIREMIDKGGKDSFLQHALALEYLKLGRDEEALAQFRDVLDREPGYVGSYYHLGKLLERQELPDEARATYEKGLVEALKAGDRHSHTELRAALDELDT